MNCPHHIQVQTPCSLLHRELPIRIADRYDEPLREKSGALTSLQSVRNVSLNDGPIRYSRKQIQRIFTCPLQLIIDVYEDFNLTDYHYRLTS